MSIELVKPSVEMETMILDFAQNLRKTKKIQ